MNNSFLQQASVPLKLLFTLVITLGGFLIFSIISVIIAVPVFGINLMDIQGGMDDLLSGENLGLLKYLQMVQSIGLFIIPPFILAWFFSTNIKKYLYLEGAPNMLNIVLVIFLMWSAIPVINYLAHVNSLMQFPGGLKGIENWMIQKEEEAQFLTESFLTADTFQVYLVNLFMMAVLPAIGEELLFRGILQKLFTEWTKNAHLGIFIAAFLFSAIHIQFFGFIPRLVLGMLFGYMLIWTGNLWLPIVAHFINNATAVTYYYYAGSPASAEEIDNVGITPETRIFLIFSFLIMLYLSWLLYKRGKGVNEFLGGY